MTQLTVNEVLKGTIDAKIRYQMAVADLTLQLAKKVGPAVIAGGAPRDWVFKRAANDIDVFIYSSWRHHRRDYYKLKDIFGIDAEDIEMLGINYGSPTSPEHGDENNIEFNKDILAVYEFMFNNQKIQVIFYNVPVDKLYQRFPVNMSQAMYSNATITTSLEFDRGIRDKTIRVSGKLYGTRQAYLDKVQSYFPNYRLIQE